MSILSKYKSIKIMALTAVVAAPFASTVYASNYTYSDVYDMATIDARSVSFTNDTSEDVKFSFLAVPYSTTDEGIALLTVSDAVSTVSGAKPIQQTSFLKSGQTATFGVKDDDTCLFGLATLNSQDFRVQFFKDTWIPTSSIRGLFGIRKKENGWVLSASEL